MKSRYLIFVREGKKITIEIKGYVGEEDHYEEGFGYIDRETGYIYIYGKQSVTFTDPWFYYDEKGDLHISPTIQLFHVDQLNELTTEKIIEMTDLSEETLSKEAREKMNAATKIYVPEIKDDDDFLKKLVKAAIIDKNINVHRLRSEVPQNYVINNLIAALDGKTKMSTKAFDNWCELLKVRVSITLEDNGTDRIDPLKKPILYVSDTNEIIDINGDKVDYQSRAYEMRQKNRNGGMFD